MICLGIESTAHTFGVGIIDEKGKILANAKDSYTTKTGGIVPIEAAKHHAEVKDKVLEEALKKSGLTLNNIDIIAFSQGPGLLPCLLQGLHFAKELVKKTKKPLVPVNHCIAHLEIGKLLTKSKDPVLLYASGANTQIIAYAAGKYRIFGETLDQGVGNFIDAFARHTGLGFPGGPKIAELAKSGSYVELPYSVKGMDVSFAGLLTNIKQKYDKIKNKENKEEVNGDIDNGNENKSESLKSLTLSSKPSTKDINQTYNLNDLAYSLQETAFAMLIEVSERAMAHLHKKELLLGGGVACNKRLQEMCAIMCKERKAESFCPPNEVLTDNAAMIAWLGILMFKAGVKIDPNKADIKPYERTDEVNVTWG